MNLLSKNESVKVFVDKNTHIQNDSIVDIILSPEFYWTRKFEIPLKNSKDIKNILPTLFEDILDDINKYQYFAYHLRDNIYVCFAYNTEEILNELIKKGFSQANINSIHFAQSEFLIFSTFNINETNYTYSEDILVKVPKNLPLNFEKIDEKIKNLTLSRHKINIKLYSNIIEQKYINILCAIFLVFIFFNFYQTINYSNQISNIEKEKDNIKTNSSLPQTSIQTKAIIISNTNKLKEQKNLRDIVSYIIDFKSNEKDGRINTIKYNDKKVQIEFIDVDIKKTKDYINKKYKITKENTIANTLILEIGI